MTAFLTIFGWFVGYLILVYFTMAMIVVSANNLGTYNIGGVPNSAKTKFFTVLVEIFLAVLWYVWITNSPFTVSIV